ncbi:MAG TPA: peptide ABC transporter substrate-binding protein [Chthoniobacteraceae bacterium]|nr:peptide ABC transporter substrate-binding protein [Chthoniobacteraceae bacterium]
MTKATARLGRAWLAVAAASLALLLAGCGHAEKRADLVFLNGAEPESIDPAIVTGQPEIRIVTALFEGLTGFGSTLEKPRPGMAESWDISDDKLVYTFHIRHDARWSNGDALTAHDFADSWERALAPATASDYSSQLYFIKNGKPYNEGTLKDFSQVGVKVIDDHTLQVTLENPTPFFLDLCAFSTLCPVHMATVKKYGDNWIKPEHIVCNGPYKLTAWRVNDRVSLEKNPYYWDAAHVSLNTIDLLPISNAMTALNFYLLGKADLMMDKGLAPVSLMADLKKRPDFHSSTFLGTYFMRFNCSKKPFDDPRVRKAFALVVDKQLLVDKITRAGEKPADSFVPPNTPGYTSPPGLGYNPDLARKLLAEVGFPGGQGFPHVNYLYASGELNEKIAIELQNMFSKELGVSVGLQKQEWKVYLNSMQQVDYDLCRSSWVGDYADANTFLNMFVTGDGNNCTGWSNADYDKLIDDAKREPDTEKRADFYRKAETMLVTEQAPVCPLYYYVGIQIYDDKKIGGIGPSLVDEHPLKDMYRKDR